MHFISSSKFFFLSLQLTFQGDFYSKQNPPPQKHSRQTRVGLCPVLCHSVLSDSVGWWDGKKNKSKYDKAVRCSHTAPHSPVVTHNHANVTVAELQPADRTGLRCASALPLLLLARSLARDDYRSLARYDGKGWMDGWTCEGSGRRPAEAQTEKK